MSEREKYTSTFTNRYGEEWIFEYDRVTGVGWLKGSDVDWQTYQVIDGRVNALILSSEELDWLRQAWWEASVE